ncbi:hypothetical protein FEF65_10020 [Mariprofundus erugo]|uniref:SLATT domain-containing protein n=1 Tax=Mariprofundus erugo TaxID=2528639 RepID=A0A5R9GN24_9PROT|nr:hypothetical protein [Mariprofundus erugo]TLS66495.1 hypothetical protein FEF65_10020 [Mariprofundus erugo]
MSVDSGKVAKDKDELLQVPSKLISLMRESFLKISKEMETLSRWALVGSAASIGLVISNSHSIGQNFGGNPSTLLTFLLLSSVAGIVSIGHAKLNNLRIEMHSHIDLVANQLHEEHQLEFETKHDEVMNELNARMDKIIPKRTRQLLEWPELSEDEKSDGETQSVLMRIGYQALALVVQIMLLMILTVVVIFS